MFDLLMVLPLGLIDFFNMGDGEKSELWKWRMFCWFLFSVVTQRSLTETPKLWNCQSKIEKQGVSIQSKMRHTETDPVRAY